MADPLAATHQKKKDDEEKKHKRKYGGTDFGHWFFEGHRDKYETAEQSPKDDKEILAVTSFHGIVHYHRPGQRVHHGFLSGHTARGGIRNVIIALIFVSASILTVDILANTTFRYAGDATVQSNFYKAAEQVSPLITLILFMGIFIAIKLSSGDIESPEVTP